MNKKNAWTLVELFMAMGVIILLSTILATTYRPNVQKAKLYIYASMANITKGTIAVKEKYAKDETGSKDLSYQNPDSTDDTFCIEMADVFTLNKTPECAIDSTISTVNLSFPNKVTVQGLATPWKKPYPTADYSFKNIVIDIDGEEGLNKVWVDRFPLRLFQGSKYEGVLQVVNCADDSIYDDEGNKITLSDDTGKSPYCKQKFNASGAIVAKEFLKDDKIINYDIYKAPATGENIKATMVASARSPLEADCGAYGGKGLYNRKLCAQYGFKLKRECASQTACEGCGTSPSVCPANENGTGIISESDCNTLATANRQNDSDINCFTLQHKPGGGMSMLVETMVGEIN